MCLSGRYWNPLVFNSQNLWKTDAKIIQNSGWRVQLRKGNKILSNILKYNGHKTLPGTSNSNRITFQSIPRSGLYYVFPWRKSFRNKKQKVINYPPIGNYKPKTGLITQYHLYSELSNWLDLEFVSSWYLKKN